MPLKLITAPSEEPVTLTQAKLQCHVDGTDEDALLTMYIAAARRAAEQRTNRALVTQTLELALDEFDEDGIELPMPPVASITSIKYIDTVGVEQTVSSGDYALSNYGTLGHSVQLAYGKTWPATQEVPNAVKVRYTAGYGAATAVPDDIKMWILLAIGTMYANRESIAMSQGALVELPGQFWQSLLDPYIA